MGEPTGPAEALGALAEDEGFAPVVRAPEGAWDTSALYVTGEVAVVVTGG